MCILQLPYSHSVFPQATVVQQPAVESLDFFLFGLSVHAGPLAVNYNLAQVQVSDDIIVVGSWVPKAGERERNDSVGRRWFCESSRNGERIREDKSKGSGKGRDRNGTRGKWFGWRKVSRDKPDKWAPGLEEPVKRKNPPFFFVVIYDVDNRGYFFFSIFFCRNNKQNTNSTDLYPRVLPHSRFHVKMFDGGRSPCHVENY